MGKPHRIAAGSLAFRNDAVLLVRYRDDNGGTYLVGPGGAVEDDENIVESIVRETEEETGIVVRPNRIAIVEDLLCARYKMVKIWMTCAVLGGDIRRTAEAEKEGIVEAGWFTRAQLVGETVFPRPLMQHDWDSFQRATWEPLCLPTRETRF